MERRAQWASVEQAEPEDLSLTKVVRFKDCRNCVPKQAFARYHWEKRLTFS